MTDNPMKTPYKGECPLLPHDWTIGEFTNGDVGIFEEITGIARIINPNGGLDKEGAKKIAQFIIDSVNNYSRVCGERDDYKECYEDTKRLAREIDIAMHGEEGAAKQASLCDLVGPAKSLRTELDKRCGELLEKEEGLEILGEKYESLRAQNAKLVEALERVLASYDFLRTDYAQDDVSRNAHAALSDNKEGI